MQNRLAFAYIFLSISLISSPGVAEEMRCGWLQNRTPGNWWLDDRDGTWIITAQGDEYEPQGMGFISAISDYAYVQTYAGYGYACACLQLEADPHKRRVQKILSVDQRSLRECREDKELPSPE
ncbi:DUF4087 domain-containing protein [Pararhizobium arenae]|uniref:DUF4087 domain-containing protein n=1 Tax=Pararhizobium arenae TaxID=1856850 RepID=UPI00094B1072|nr:DUF4087 domain-containing protein [Pararhizobium arenae]